MADTRTNDRELTIEELTRDLLPDLEFLQEKGKRLETGEYYDSEDDYEIAFRALSNCQWAVTIKRALRAEKKLLELTELANKLNSVAYKAIVVEDYETNLWNLHDAVQNLTDKINS